MGKAATFDVVAKRLCKSEAPMVDDAFAESLGYDSLEEMRKDFAGRRQRDHDQLARTRIKRQLLDALSERVSFPIPEAMREREFDEIWRRLQAEKEAGRLDEDDKDKDDDTLRAEYGAIAERRVRLGLLLAEIGRVNNLSVTDDELGQIGRAHV